MKKYYLLLIVCALYIKGSCLNDCLYGLKFKFDLGLKKELFQAIENDNFEKLQSIVRRNRDHAHVTNKLGCTPLYLAVLHQNLPIIKFLLAYRARPHMLTANGDSALHLATKNRMTEIVVHLLSGASTFMYTRDGHGCTPFDYAEENGYHFLAKMLKTNQWQKINPEEFIETNQEFFDLADDILRQDFFFTDNYNAVEEYAKNLIQDVFPEQLENSLYIIYELKKELRNKIDNNIFCISKNEVKNFISSLFNSNVAHQYFPERFAYCDLISASGGYSRPYPVNAETDSKTRLHPITRTPINLRLGLLSSFKYWQAKKLPLTDFNNTLKEGDPISFEEFEIPIAQAQALAEFQNIALPEDLIEHGSNGFLPSSTFIDLLNVKKTES
jgi:hypothetical protein